jgi:hypothetical protein
MAEVTVAVMTRKASESQKQVAKAEASESPAYV